MARSHVPADRTGSRAGLSVVIAVLTWRGEKQTRECLRGLTKLRGWPVPTLVVDNASGTGEGERLAAEFGPPVRALTRDLDDGVPGGYNAAIDWAISQGAAYVLLLNNDVLVTDETMLDQLIEAAGPEIAAVGPIVRDPDGAVFSAGGHVDWFRGRGVLWREPQAPAPYAAEWLDGPCLLVSTEAARKIGGLAPEFFMYWEDLDWAVRAGEAGYRLRVQPSTSITHVRGNGMASLSVRGLSIRNGILFMRRHGTASQNVTALAWAIFYRSPGVAVRCLRNPRDLVHLPSTLASAFWWNLADAIRRGRWLRAADGPPLGTTR